MVPLQYDSSGDKIEILTRPDQTPSRGGSKSPKPAGPYPRYVVTFERKNRNGARIGRELLENEVKRLGYTFNRLLRDGTIQSAGRVSDFETPNISTLHWLKAILLFARFSPNRTR